MSATITLAVNTSSSLIEHIDQVNKNNKFAYHCKECEEPLTVVKSPAQKKENHFRHRSDSLCSGKYDKALHDYAVQLIMENNSMVIAEQYRMQYTNPLKEQAIGQKRSDIRIWHQNTEVHLEVVVTSDMNDDKLTYYAAMQVRCVRIDLTGPHLRKASRKEIEWAVSENWTNKVLLNWDILSTPGNNTSSSLWEQAGIMAAIVTALILIRKIFKIGQKREYKSEKYIWRRSAYNGKYKRKKNE